MASEPVNFINPIQAMTTTRPYRTTAVPTAVMMWSADCTMLLAVLFKDFPYLCWGPPVKSGIRWLFGLFGLVPARACSRWTAAGVKVARSAVRTNDLEADEDSPHAGGRVDRANTL